MPSETLLIDGLLDPITPDQPAGTDLRWTPEWDRIKEARRADDGLDSGKWVKKERKSAEWPLVQELATTMLRQRSKDLQLAMWLTEANIKLQGFAGLGDGLRLVRELMLLYWDDGLYPQIEDGPEDRAGPLQWLNDKLADAIAAVPITVRSDQGRDYSFLDLEDARRVGSESSWRGADGETNVEKKNAYENAIAGGHISMEMFDHAVRQSKRAGYERLAADFLRAHEEFRALEKIIDEKFGEAAPNLSACRNTLREMEQAISDNLATRRAAEPEMTTAVDQQPAGESGGGRGVNSPDRPLVLRLPLSLPTTTGPQTAAADSWQEAEMLIRSGQVDRGLAEMTRLASSETSGRSRFQRKLLLAEVCLAGNRERLARSILEELAEQIDSFHLESWETSDLIGSVWTRLYRLYRNAEETDRAATLYERLCRLDPWQALHCE
jgi:type VI secretion system protein ImpA